MSQQNECKRCGTCCKNGGPALHSQDLPLIEKGFLTFEALITIRKGELAHDPVIDAIAPVPAEFIKIRGTKGSWACIFYDDRQNGCTIYDHRPLACKVLRCWDTREILELAGTDLLSREDIIKKDNPLKDKWMEHEALFPVPPLNVISRTISRSSKNTIKKLERLCNRELAHRMQIVHQFHLSIEQELFYFGRPIFELLTSLGFAIRETGTGIKLKFR